MIRYQSWQTLLLSECPHKKIYCWHYSCIFFKIRLSAKLTPLLCDFNCTAIIWCFEVYSVLVSIKKSIYIWKKVTLVYISEKNFTEGEISSIGVFSAIMMVDSSDTNYSVNIFPLLRISSPLCKTLSRQILFNTSINSLSQPINTL